LKKWTGPDNTIEVNSPQVVVLEEPNSRKQFTVNVEQIKSFNAATLNTPNSISQTTDTMKSKTTNNKQEATASMRTRSSGSVKTAGSLRRTSTLTVCWTGFEQARAQEHRTPRVVLRLVGEVTETAFPSWSHPCSILSQNSI